MFLFAAVMLTDIILLDFYNTIALPTSTTVSIVFELLGSAIAISFFSVFHKGEPIAEWGNYMNGSRALTIIVGIFLSVVIAFILGWIIQYLARILVTFEVKKSMKSFGSIFGAASVSLIVIFIILKGLKGIPLLSTDILTILKTNIGLISLISFGISFILFQILIRISGFNVYRFITLLGTFALAMAFASNDLVNFIGVPIASFDSYIHWKSAPTESTNYMMGTLAEPVQTNPLFLIIAGIIMIVTLWSSRKARSVVQTSVNLGRQSEGFERFEGNEISRGLVKTISSMSTMITKLLPDKIINKIDSRFQPITDDNNQKNKPAFDLVRSSVNLIVAAGIILIATSFKLPLSTTFVTFMVLMGTSLADKAWAKGSAVYRVSGVLIVVGGWFLTAIIALMTSIIFASLLINFKIYALALLVLFAIYLIVRNLKYYSIRKKAEDSLSMKANTLESDLKFMQSSILQNVSLIFQFSKNSYSRIIYSLIDKKSKEFSIIRNDYKDAQRINSLNKIDITRQLADVPNQYQTNAKILMIIYDLEENVLQPISEILKICDKHVRNLHQDLIEEQVKSLKMINSELERYIDDVIKEINKKKINNKRYAELKAQKKSLIHQLEDYITNQIVISNKKKLSSKNSQLILSILFSTKNLIFNLGRYVKLLHIIGSEDFSKNMLDQIIEG
jgi:phosphate/sulfate permease